jgi:hypothetical protein
MVHRYLPSSLYGDYLRAAIGTAFLGPPLYFAAGSPVVATILGTLLLLFVGFGVRTAIRHFTRIETTPESLLAIGPFGRAMPWNGINKVELKYFSTQRDRKGGDGWIQLKVCDQTGCMKLESTLERFDELVAKVATAAFSNGAEMSELTVENLTMMGITLTFPEEEKG